MLTRVVAAVALFVVGGLLGAASDAERAMPRAPAGPESLLGGFSALAVQILWIRADEARDRGDTAEALLLFDLIADLEPQLVEGAAFIAHEVGTNFAADATTPEQRWGLVAQGTRILDRTVRDNPGVAAALLARGNHFIGRIGGDDDLTAAFARHTGRSPYAAAYADFRAAQRLDPSSHPALDGLGLAGLYHGWELCRTGEFDAAETVLAEAARAFEESGRRYRAGGLESVAVDEFARPFAQALLEAVRAPAGERDALVRAAYAHFVGERSLPGLPPPAPR